MIHLLAFFGAVAAFVIPWLVYRGQAAQRRANSADEKLTAARNAFRSMMDEEA